MWRKDKKYQWHLRGACYRMSSHLPHTAPQPDSPTGGNFIASTWHILHTRIPTTDQKSQPCNWIWRTIIPSRESVAFNLQTVVSLIDWNQTPVEVTDEKYKNIICIFHQSTGCFHRQNFFQFFSRHCCYLEITPCFLHLVLHVNKDSATWQPVR